MAEPQKSFLLQAWKTQRALCIVWIGVILYTAFFSAVSFQRYDAFSFNDFDFAIFVHENWKILHGSGEISLFNNVPIWGNALEFINAVTAPVFFIAGYDPRVLLFLQSFALGASAIPIFLIGRARMPEALAASLALSFLFYPPIQFANLYEYNPLVYSTFTLLMAFYFMERQRFGMFMLFIFLSIINRADLGIVTFMFGGYAFVCRKPWKWVIWPSLFSFIWVAVGLLVVIPAFKGDLSYDSAYPQFGKGFGEIIRNMVFNPKILWDSLATAINARYFFCMLFPAGFLSFMGLKEFMICSLSLLQHLASTREQEHLIIYHYTSTITPFVYISAAYGLARVSTKRGFVPILCVMVMLFAVASNFFYGPISQYKRYAMQLVMDDEDAYKKELIDQIPDEAAVVSTFGFSPMLAGRNSYYSFHYIYKGYFNKTKLYETPKDIEYALIDFGDPRVSTFARPDSDLRMRKFFSEGGFRAIDRVNSVVLFKKYDGPEPSLDLYQIHPQSDRPVLAETQNGVSLVSAESRLIKKKGHNLLNISQLWRTNGPVHSNFSVLTVIVDDKGKKIAAINRLPCYGIYPEYRWKQGEEITDQFDLLLPESLKAGQYRVYMALLTMLSSPGKFIPFVKIDGNGIAGKPDEIIMLGTFEVND
ncbi:MAG: DUF2079 domain-containing protein [Candidatus Omnitrophica bacterium]|nr:DUF2079 domain-containing protein [Candidatus Omnitrophota bacterium]